MLIMTAVLRSSPFQSAAYGLMLGILCVLPALVPFTFDVGGFAAVFLGIAYAGAVPAIVAGAMTWSCILLCQRRQRTFPLGVLAPCWFGTTVGAYLLVPVWGMLQDALRRCRLDGTWSLLSYCIDTVAPTTNGLTSIVVIGFMVTAPIVLPLLLIGAWLWVGMLWPRLAGPRPMPGTTDT